MDSPLRILHVVVNMNRGGAETLLMNLYRNVDKSKIQFDFLTFKPGVFDQEIISMGGRIHRIPYITDAGHVGFTKGLKQFLQHHKEYKIIHAHMDKMSGLILKAAKEVHIPIRIAHSHNTQSEGTFFAKMYKWYAGNHILKSATHLYACSSKAARWLYGSKSEQGVILKNGIETDKFQFSTTTRKTIRNELDIAEDTLVLGNVGRFSQQKNHLFLLDIFADVTKKIPNSELVLVGDGTLKNDIIHKIKELQLEDRVKLLGVRADIHQLLQAFDLFIMPSLHEGLPVTLIEAQGAGLPCLISNKITREVDLGMGLVHYLPLTGKQDWINTVNSLNREKKQREISNNILSKEGYDIKKTAKLITSAYRDMTLGEKAI